MTISYGIFTLQHARVELFPLSSLNLYERAQRPRRHQERDMDRPLRHQERAIDQSPEASGAGYGSSQRHQERAMDRPGGMRSGLWIVPGGIRSGLWMVQRTLHL